MVPLALCWLTIPSAEPIELLRAAAAGGFASVGMRVVESGEPDKPYVGGGGESATIVKRAAAAEGVSIFRTAGFRLDGRYSAERYYRYLEASAQLGAGIIGVIVTDNDRSRLTADFADLCTRASEFGLSVGVEFVPFSTVKTIEDAYDLLVRSEQSNGSILLDSMHLYRSGGNADSVRRIPPSRISVAQLCDCRMAAPEPSKLLEEARNDRLDPGEGELPLFDFMEVVPPGIPLEIETPCLAQRDLTPIERAKRTGQATRKFLDDFQRARG